MSINLTLCISPAGSAAPSSNSLALTINSCKHFSFQASIIIMTPATINANPVFPAKAGIHDRSGYRVKSGMTKVHLFSCRSNNMMNGSWRLGANKGVLMNAKKQRIDFPLTTCGRMRKFQFRVIVVKSVNQFFRREKAYCQGSLCKG